ncbi:DNA-binding protein WhiA [Mycoplasmopsis hyopharyngis]|uniref:DNA-binding protein WhiA n=1 Tax=Mycoplasmopsis hyopharyngis TaxID=29558 RepID=UPI0038739CAD
MNTKNKLNFAKQIKFEVLKNVKTLAQTNEFLKGFVYSAGLIENEKIFINIKSKEIKDKVLSFFKKINLNVEKEYKNKQKFLVINKSSFNLNEKVNDYSIFFAGVFCGGGNIQDLNTTNYHLSLRSYNKQFIDFILNKLNKYSNFNFKLIQIQKKYVIYLSKQESISDFLKAIEAVSAYFVFVENKIQRDLENNVNRINNIDICNLNKIALSGQKHLSNIEYLFENNLDSNFNEIQKMFFEQKREQPYESLKNLRQIIKQSKNIDITKSTMNNWLIKLRKIVEKDKNEKQKSS